MSKKIQAAKANTGNDNSSEANVPNAADAAEAVRTIAQLEGSWPVQAPLTVRERKVFDQRIAHVGEPAIERAAQILTEHGGAVGNLSVGLDHANEIIAYAHAYGPVALRARELSERIEDDIRRRMESLASRTQLMITSLRALTKTDPTLLPFLRDLGALRPTRKHRAKRTAAPAAQPDANQPARNTTASSQPAAATTDSKVLVLHGEQVPAASIAPRPSATASPTNGVSNGASYVPSNGASNGSANGASKAVA